MAVERSESGRRRAAVEALPARTDEQVTLAVPVKTDDLVLTLLGRALARLSPDEAEAMAEEVGIEYGRAMARARAAAASPTGSARSAPRCTPWPTP